MAANAIPRVKPARAVRIYCPVAIDTWKALLGGEIAAIEADAAAGAMVAIIRSSDALGHLGPDKGVFEVSLGLESFIPTRQAAPTLGEAEKPSMSPTVVITTFINDEATSGQLENAFKELLHAHPWEVPIIEVGDTRLLLKRAAQLT